MQSSAAPSQSPAGAVTAGVSEHDGAPPFGTIDLAEWLNMLRLRRGIIAGTALLVLALGAIYAFTATPIYEATARVIVEPKENRVVDMEAVLQGLSNDQTTIANQIEIIRSRSLAGRVVSDLNLENDPRFNPPEEESPGFLTMLDPRGWFGGADAPPLPGEDAVGPEQELISRLLSDLTVSLVGRSSAISVTYEHPDARFAAQIANAVAEAYVTDQLEVKFNATRRATEWLAQRLDELRSEVQMAEAAVEQYKISNEITEAGDGTSIVNQRLVQLNAQLAEEKLNLADAQANLSQASRLYNQGYDIDAIAQQLDSGLISGLRQQEAMLVRREAELGNRYGARHPRMIELQAERDNLRRRIDEEVRRVIQQLRNEVAVAGNRVASLESSLSELEGEAADENKARIRLRDLERTAQSNRALFESYLARFNETEDQEDIQASDARVLSAATVPQNPSWPRKSLVLIGAAFGGVLMGLGLAFTVELLDNGFRRGGQVEAALGLVNLATVPEVDSQQRRQGISPVRMVIEKPLSSYTEALRGFQTALMLSNIDETPKVVAVTSALPAEGKTTFSASFARLVAAQGKKVLLLDADLRHPNVHLATELGDPEQGIVELLSRQVERDKAIIRDSHAALDVLPVAMKPRNPPDLLSSNRMRELIKELSDDYDLIVMDCSPVLPVHDTKHVMKLADRVVFVVRWERTPRRACADALKQMRTIEAPLAGTVMTRADVRRHALYNYGYYDYYQYSKYYTD